MKDRWSMLHQSVGQPLSGVEGLLFVPPGGSALSLAEVARLVADFTPKRGPRGSISWFFDSENRLASL